MNTLPSRLKQADDQVRAARRKFCFRVLSAVFWGFITIVPMPFLPAVGPPIIGLSFVGIIVLFCLVDLYVWRLDVLERNRVRFQLAEQRPQIISN